MNPRINVLGVSPSVWGVCIWSPEVSTWVWMEWVCEELTPWWIDECLESGTWGRRWQLFRKLVLPTRKWLDVKTLTFQSLSEASGSGQWEAWSPRGSSSVNCHRSVLGSLTGWETVNKKTHLDLIHTKMLIFLVWNWGNGRREVSRRQFVLNFCLF